MATEIATELAGRQAKVAEAEQVVRDVEAQAREAANRLELSSPVRVSILTALNGETRSSVALAKELELPVQNIAYHVAVLRDLGVIKQTDTRPRGGALEHFYQAVWEFRIEASPIK